MYLRLLSFVILPVCIFSRVPPTTERGRTFSEELSQIAARNKSYTRSLTSALLTRITSNASDVDALFLMGCISFVAGDRASAVYYYHQCAELTAFAEPELVLCYANLLPPQDAVPVLLRGLQHDGSNAALLDRLYVMYVTVEDFTSALPLLYEALDRVPSDLDLWDHFADMQLAIISAEVYGDSRLTSLNNSNAVAAILSGLSIFPRHAGLNYLFAYHLHTTGNTTCALYYYFSALAAIPFAQPKIRDMEVDHKIITSNIERLQNSGVLNNSECASMIASNRDRLLIGCSEWEVCPNNGSWVVVDLAETPMTHIILDISQQTLPLHNNSIKEIYASHVLEHVSLPPAAADASSVGTIDFVLSEFHRVLIAGGRLAVAVPDMRILASMLLNSSIQDDKVMYVLYGGQKVHHDFHRSGYTEASLTHLLQTHGFCNITRVDSFDYFNDCSELVIEEQKISLNMIAEKCSGDWLS